MKKSLIFVLLAVLLMIVLFVALSSTSNKVFDRTVKLRKGYTIPYGAEVAYQALPTMFPSSNMEVIRSSPSKWFYGHESVIKNTLYFILSEKFNPTEEEIVLLERFVKNGNYVCIVSPKMNTTASNFFDLKENFAYENFSMYSEVDSPKVNLLKPCFAKDTTYTYPGFSFHSTLTRYPLDKFAVLGTNQQGYANCIKASVGEGIFILHANPFMFSNYFLLYQNNADYFQKIMSVFPASVKNIYWDEYYIFKEDINDQNKQDGSLFSELFKHAAFKWAFWLTILFLSIYLLLNAKRKQRIVPIIPKPTNDSLAFAQTIGKLYFDKGDHANLAAKMVQYFLEHIRSKYQINTSVLDEAFAQKLIGKSGYAADNVRLILQAIETIYTSNSISQEQLKKYYELFQHFYKTTA